MITVGFTLIGRGNWTGGETYLRNMLGVITSKLCDEVRAVLFLSPTQAEKIGDSLTPFLDRPPIVDDAFDGTALRKRLISTLISGSDSACAEVFQQAGVDVVFEPAVFYGRNFPVPAVSWIPDFQHRRLAHLFSKVAWWRRDIGFRVQTNANRTIMLSSKDAGRDCEEFYPRSVGKTKVVRFAIDLDPGDHVKRKKEILSTYDLPDRYFYLPNQFWSHKNHNLVVEALRQIKHEGNLERTAPVIMTGRTDDPRDPGGFDRLMEAADKAGIATHFRYLGLIPYEDVFGLNASADALINPSFFEGWSTTVEEAKALGTRMILSDINIHREQAPDASFFNPKDAASLAAQLVELSAGPAYKRAGIASLRKDHDKRRQNYADALLETFKAAADHK